MIREIGQNQRNASLPLVDKLFVAYSQPTSFAVLDRDYKRKKMEIHIQASFPYINLGKARAGSPLVSGAEHC